MKLRIFIGFTIILAFILGFGLGSYKSNARMMEIDIVLASLHLHSALRLEEGHVESEIQNQKDKAQETFEQYAMNYYAPIWEKIFGTHTTLELNSFEAKFN